MKRSIIQLISILFAGAVGLYSALESFLIDDRLGKSTDRYLYVLLGAVAALFIIYYAFIGQLYKKADMWIFLSLFVYAFLVTWMYYGFSVLLFTLRFYYIWFMCVFLFVAVRVMPKPERLVRTFAFAYVLTVCALGVFILVRATMTLREQFPSNERLLGCFRVGRLCGMINANTMSFHCMTAIMLSLYSCVKGGRKRRIFYGSAIVILWFLMGLNNCRTTNFALAFTVGAFVFALIRKLLAKKGAKTIKKNISAAAAAGATALAVIFVLMLPTLIYRTGVTAAAKIARDQQMLDNVALIYERNVSDVETLTDRTLVWKRSVELIFKNPRRTLFGISVRSPEAVNGAYEGRHDIAMPFAHTMFLEIFRRLGLIGLLIWIVLLCIWGIRAVSKFLDTGGDNAVIYLMAAAAGALLTGITEQGPFLISTAIAVPYLFFLCCGAAMRDDDNEKADNEEKDPA